MEGSQRTAGLLLLLLLVQASKTGQEAPSTTVNKTEEQGDRMGKLLSVFTVIKFPNVVCESATVGRNGTCYTSSECLAKSGSISGGCASGFGVCCVFETSCGSGSVSENHTYFTSSAITKGSNCNFQICRSNSNICQLRLDFETFVLNLPVTLAPTATADTDGATQGNSAGAGAFTLGGTCHVDTFGVSAPGYPSLPTICGTNTGEHMYVPAAEQCNVLSANIGDTSTSTTGSFTIKISQIPCDSPVLPRRGCLQYFYGSAAGTIQSFNYQAAATGFQQTGKSQLLANQHYTACVRTERGNCAICYWTPDIQNGFHMSLPGGTPAISVFGWDTNCGHLGVGTTIAVAIGGVAHGNGGSYDHIMIPSGICHPGQPTDAVSVSSPVDRYCGTVLNCQGLAGDNAIDNGTPDATVCTNIKPFTVAVHTDGVEYAHPVAEGEHEAPNNAGFRLNYFMKTGCLWYPTLIGV